MTADILVIPREDIGREEAIEAVNELNWIIANRGFDQAHREAGAARILDGLDSGPRMPDIRARPISATELHDAIVAAMARLA